ncbi:glycosyl transferase family 4 [Dehalobacterium formicoaceticum]|uniref:UDP-N-acetylmuramyl pentapeptide phosphotransferase/UDP-N-acetylglucosamine-1-phosphate transferase n=1 Tax=Dehalobacterium formicoaceticum TaxID=51515 RepID=A0ABT1Y4L1_9FIRM|nr:glycosyl transferase family 4 [Dehalobacterium formicoaceticum]MCR6545810.1 hypothetical protein [Dehalobacterium formicoaceticum]
MANIIFFIIAFTISYYITPKILEMLSRGGIKEKNIRGRTIPVAAGIIFTAVLAPVFFLQALFFDYGTEAYMYLGFVTLVSFAGFVDDAAGTGESKGFSGHFSYLLHQKKWTTGIWKVALCGITAALASLVFSNSWYDLIINTLLIALMANFFNLLDVCPGRSIKVFLLGSLLIMVFLPSDTVNILLLPLLGAVGAYAIYDFQGQGMMGDAGSNVLGLALGLTLVAAGSLSLRVVTLVLLVLLHGVSEKISFSEIIKNNKMLDQLDRLGRRD